MSNRAHLPVPAGGFRSGLIVSPSLACPRENPKGWRAFSGTLGQVVLWGVLPNARRGDFGPSLSVSGCGRSDPEGGRPDCPRRSSRRRLTRTLKVRHAHGRSPIESRHGLRPEATRARALVRKAVLRFSGARRCRRFTREGLPTTGLRTPAAGATSRSVSKTPLEDAPWASGNGDDDTGGFWRGDKFGAGVRRIRGLGAVARG
jgi:hypothetical protein